MITKNTSHKKAILKQALVVPVIAGITLLFSTTIRAQEVKQPPVVSNRQIEAAPQNAPQDVVDEYEAILKPYKVDTEEGWKNFHKALTAEDKIKLEALYKKMSREQQNKQLVSFMPPPKPFKKTVPSENLFTKFKDPSQYGVWLNDKKISNGLLDKYTATDISHYFISNLYGAAKKGRSYKYQVNLMTNSYYQKYYEDAIKLKDNIMIVKWVKNKEGRMVVPPGTRQ